MGDRKPVEGGFFKFLYNSDTGEVMGRTGMSWRKYLSNKFYFRFDLFVSSR
jgi:hypothetical protein